MPDGPEPIVRQYFYEIAQGNEPGQLAALLEAGAGLAGDVRLGFSVP